MLKKSLIVKTSPIANDKNVIMWKDYRVTVLDGRLFRLEKNPNKTFNDCATQTVWFRDMPPQEFDLQLNEDNAIIKTPYCSLLLRENRKDCYILLNGKKVKISNCQNLLGTYRTLDGYNGNRLDWPEKNLGIVKLENGVCSKSGVAVIDDSNSLILNDNGEIVKNPVIESDEYIFAFDNDYLSAVKSLYAITGKTPIVPRYALGNWWSRYHAYTDDEYLTLLTKFKEKDVPLTVATIDMDWHYSWDLDSEFGITEKGRMTDYYGFDNGWTGYSWNKTLFPDYKAFLKEIENMNLKITLNIHPADGVRWFEDAYPDMAKAMNVDPDTGKWINFDITDDNFINAYFDVLHKPYEKDGVAFWWIDWQQGTNTKIEGLDPLWSLNHYHYLDNAENHYNPLILSRYSGIGSHRYPVGFSGDTFMTWKTLNYLPYFTATASNIGYTWWSHDIGGHQQGKQDNQLFLRSVQFGVFSPINRLHSANYLTMSKEPWRYSNGCDEITMKFLRLRHALIPYIYTHSYNTSYSGQVIIQPLYYHYDCEQAYKYKNEYFFGDLLVAPVTSPLKKDGYARVKAFIPQGVWTDIFTGESYSADEKGREVTLYRRLDSIPVLIKAGGILPLSLDKGNSIDNPQKMEIDVYKGDGEFTLYEDGREKQSDKQLLTKFTTRLELKGNNACVQTLTISADGDSSVIPSNRVYRIIFKDIKNGKVTAYENGKPINAIRLRNDFVAIELDYNATSNYQIQVTFNMPTEFERVIENTINLMSTFEDDNNVKFNTLNDIFKTTSLDEFIKTVDESDLKNINKLKLKEIL